MLDSFWIKVEKTDSCWNWKAFRNHLGYGTFNVKGKLVKAHRYSYELTKGKIPDGLEIDHLCKNRGCVNPDHLEAVTNKENILRGESFSAIHAKKTHCPKGHEYNKENTYHGTVRGGRYCKICQRQKYKEYVEKNREKVKQYQVEYHRRLREELL